MREIFYYQPIIKPVASNGSLKFGVTLITQMWEEGKQLRKMELSIHGKDEQDVLEKFKNTMSGESKNTELKCEYYLCGKDVVEVFKPFEVSKPFKSGFKLEQNDEYFVAWLNFEEVEKHYNEVIEPNENSDDDFWCRECTPGTMDDSKISMRNAKKVGLLLEISEKIDITSQRNQAMTICNLANRFGCTPVQLINKYL